MRGAESGPGGTVVVEVIREKRRKGRERMLTSLDPATVGWIVAVALLLLVAFILLEPLRHAEELPYYHPPGMSPAVTPAPR